MWKTGSLSDEDSASPVDLSLSVDKPQPHLSLSASESISIAETDDPETLIVGPNSNLDLRIIVHVSADDQHRTRRVLKFVQFSLKNDG